MNNSVRERAVDDVQDSFVLPKSEICESAKGVSALDNNPPMVDDMGPTVSMAIQANDDSQFERGSFELKRTKSLNDYFHSNREKKNRTINGRNNRIRLKRRFSYDDKFTYENVINLNESISLFSPPIIPVDCLMIKDDNDLNLNRPEKFVDYLSYNWSLLELYKSWNFIVSWKNFLNILMITRYFTPYPQDTQHREKNDYTFQKNKKTDYNNIIDTNRLENITWRLWFKLKNNLKSLSNNYSENANSKNNNTSFPNDSDLILLYGPLISDQNRTSKNNSCTDIKENNKMKTPLKPILKKQNLSETITENSMWKLKQMRFLNGRNRLNPLSQTFTSTSSSSSSSSSSDGSSSILSSSSISDCCLSAKIGNLNSQEIKGKDKDYHDKDFLSLNMFKFNKKSATFKTSQSFSSTTSILKKNTSFWKNNANKSNKTNTNNNHIKFNSIVQQCIQNSISNSNSNEYLTIRMLPNTSLNIGDNNESDSLNYEDSTNSVKTPNNNNNDNNNNDITILSDDDELAIYFDELEEEEDGNYFEYKRDTIRTRNAISHNVNTSRRYDYMYDYNSVCTKDIPTLNFLATSEQKKKITMVNKNGNFDDCNGGNSDLDDRNCNNTDLDVIDLPDNINLLSLNIQDSNDKSYEIYGLNHDIDNPAMIPRSPVLSISSEDYDFKLSTTSLPPPLELTKTRNFITGHLLKCNSYDTISGKSTITISDNNTDMDKNTLTTSSSELSLPSMHKSVQQVPTFILTSDD